MDARSVRGGLLGSLLLVPTVLAGDRVQVFVLAGQSNMEGKAKNELLEHQATDARTRSHFAHLRNDGEWITRDDVFVKFLERRGPLTVGYGSPGRTGVELELGTVLGDALDEPVLLIKAAWGGHSLFKLFRPPSAGLPRERMEAELAKAIERTQRENAESRRDEAPPTMEAIRADYGRSYRDMLAEVEHTLAHLGELFPELAGKEPEIAGFVWFQGWNDQYEGAETEYASNLGHLIRDVRRDLGVPGLPFVIGVMGQNQSQPAQGAMLVIQEAQLGVPELPEFRSDVRAVRTDVLVDRAAEALYPTWRENREEWERTGSDHPYHYLGSAIWFNRMGRAFGEALLELMD